MDRCAKEFAAEREVMSGTGTHTLPRTLAFANVTRENPGTAFHSDLPVQESSANLRKRIRRRNHLVTDDGNGQGSQDSPYPLPTHRSSSGADRISSQFKIFLNPRRIDAIPLCLKFLKKSVLPPPNHHFRSWLRRHKADCSILRRLSHRPSRLPKSAIVSIPAGLRLMLRSRSRSVAGSVC